MNPKQSSKILRNRGKCKKCGSVIESKHRHDFVRCACGAVAVDGGTAYLRRIGNLADFEDMSEYGPVRSMKDYQDTP